MGRRVEFEPSRQLWLYLDLGLADRKNGFDASTTFRKHVVFMIKLYFLLLCGLLSVAPLTAAGPAPVLRVPLYANEINVNGTDYVRDGSWLAVNVDQSKSARITTRVPVSQGVYTLNFHAVGENDGRPTHRVSINDRLIGTFQTPLSNQTTEEGPAYTHKWDNIEISEGDTVTVESFAHSEDGQDIARGRWSRIVFSRPAPDMSNLHADITPSKGVYGELKLWHKITFAFEGPETSERANPNPFLDYRLTLTFTHDSSGVVYHVPGYYAADGMGSESSSESGNIWRAHFTPDLEGLWTWKASFRQGPNIAIEKDDKFSEPVFFDGETGGFQVGATDKTGRDFRAKGRLEYVGEHYLRFKGNGEYFIKGGADSPENLLAYIDFDGPRPVHERLHEGRSGEAAESPLHTYEPHLTDWNEGDAVWQKSKGKGLVGALNYLAGKGMNSVYFLTMNVEGDGNDVWPWTHQEERFRFDCSKLDQWEIVFSHMEKRGLLLHVVTQETENDQLLDSGENGLQRKLYYRELLARFGHHLGVVWNLGEENTNTDRQRMAFCQEFTEVDPYNHPVVVHTYPGQYDRVYTPLLGFHHFEGPSLQMGDMKGTHEETFKWIQKSSESGRPWVVNLDEIGPASTGVKPDKDDFWHDDVRHHALWGHLMAGGAGVEWYFGYQYDHNDLNCEDWRSRDHMWDLTRIALDFFQKNLPFSEMTSADHLVGNSDAYVLAKPGHTYALYLPAGKTVSLDLRNGPGRYRLKWFNPRTGGPLHDSVIETVVGGQPNVTIGNPPSDPEKDWVVILNSQVD